MRLNIFIQSIIPIPRPFISAAVVVDSGNGTYDLEYFNRTIDVCRLLSDAKYEPFFQLVIRLTLPSSNLPRKCPFKTVLLDYHNINYSLNSFYFAERFFCEKL